VTLEYERRSRRGETQFSFCLGINNLFSVSVSQRNRFGLIIVWENFKVRWLKNEFFKHLTLEKVRSWLEIIYFYKREFVL